MRYSYDNLNRLKDSQYFHVQNYSAVQNGGYPTEQYREQLNYDLSGNISSLLRKDEVGNVMDNLTYGYQAGKNRLNVLQENAAFTASKQDNSESTGFSYDANGNMLSRDGVCNLNYNVRNLLTQVIKGKRDSAVLAESLFLL
jgi:hypothetical protein